MLETPAGWGLLLVVGVITGVLSGILGIGGGILMVPVLTFFGVPLVQATATSLVGVLLSSTSGSIRNFSAGELNWKNSLLIAVFGMLTAQLGAWLGDRLPDPILSLAFAVLLVVTIRLIDLKRSLQRKHAAETEDGSTSAPDTAAANTQATPWLAVIGIGLTAGFLSGMFGIGGGVVMVPLQMLLLAEPIKAAVRTSLGAIVPISISGLVQHTINNNVLWIPGISLGLGGLLGAQFGTRMLPKLGDRTVNRLFRFFLLALAVYMVIRGIRGLT